MPHTPKNFFASLRSAESQYFAINASCCKYLLQIYRGGHSGSDRSHIGGFETPCYSSVSLPDQFFSTISRQFTDNFWVGFGSSVITWILPENCHEIAQKWSGNEPKTTRNGREKATKHGHQCRGFGFWLRTAKNSKRFITICY